MRRNGLSHIFSAWIVSEAVGCQKTDARMFRAAMEGLGLTDADRGRILMVGNNLERDVAGANRFGIRSALLDWSPRYRHEPANGDEVPDYRIHFPGELPGLAERLNDQLHRESAMV